MWAKEIMRIVGYLMMAGGCLFFGYRLLHMAEDPAALLSPSLWTALAGLVLVAMVEAIDTLHRIEALAHKVHMESSDT
jgi:hypothetical protein